MSIVALIDTSIVDPVYCESHGGEVRTEAPAPEKPKQRRDTATAWQDELAKRAWQTRW